MHVKDFENRVGILFNVVQSVNRVHKLNWTATDNSSRIEAVATNDELVEIRVVDHENNLDYLWSTQDQDDVTVADIEDIVEKCTGIVNHTEFDRSVTIPLDLPKSVIYDLALEAHRRDITLNSLLLEVIQVAVERASQE